ncbi:MAG: bifunctional acetaldehyde-CoA/alcohol dehydrogenase [Defluviitaleaceae bacterium]|nr:bifunctional acetaldehyde-CoA/alcohol dehydrogenase [Defluviitaleaceae bacterium]
MTRNQINSVETLRKGLERTKKAQKAYSTFTQEQVDKIFKSAALAANHARIPLAKLSISETQRGILEDKVIKNHYAAEYTYNAYKDTKTVGVIEEDKAMGVKKIVEPIGVIAAVTPVTNPTSTTIFKILLALKTRNGIVLASHPSAKGVVIETAKIMLDAAIKAGAPENIIEWIDEPTLELTTTVMAESDLVLATGGPGMVRAAHSSGTPAIGVGSGNTPVVVDSTADIKMTVSSILVSKTFDNGMICASEQAVVVAEDIYDDIKKEFEYRGAFILNKEETKKVGDFIVQNGRLNAAIVGQSAFKIAEMAGIKVPEETKVLIGEVEKTDTSESFSYEKLSPVLALYKAKNFDDALQKAYELIHNNGLGHTAAIYIDTIKGAENLKKFENKMPASRLLVNSPAAHGGIGDLYNFALKPSLTLGCGSWGRNSVSENVGVKHLLNTKTVAERRENMLWFRVPSKIYFKRGCTNAALDELRNVIPKKRVFIVTDNYLLSSGSLAPVTDKLNSIDITYTVFSGVKPDPTLDSVREIAAQMEEFKPDCIIAFGGGSPIDAAKIAWLLYEHPDCDFFDLAMRFMDIRKRVETFPALGEKAYFVAIPTTAGTGAEVTPFAVITDGQTGVKYPIADYQITPHMAIIDANFMDHMPKGLTAATGIDVMTHAVESYVSTVANNYTQSLSLQAVKLVFQNLERAYKNGANDPQARENMADASAIAGMAFGNGFLGICHSTAHKIGATFNIPHGVANGLMLEEAIRFNMTERPVKMSAFPQYTHPTAKERYAEIADFMGFGGKTADEKVENFIKEWRKLKKAIEIPDSIKDFGVSEADFMAKLDYIAENAFDDQCTSANPRYPLIKELREIYLTAYYGRK